MDPKAILEQIQPWVLNIVQDQGLELVNISWHQGTVLRILLDGPEHVDLAACARVSRAIGDQLEVLELITFAYTLEVGTPGLDWPLSQPAQFKRNQGRRLKVVLQSGETIKGRLKAAVDDQSICLEWEKGEISKGRKRVEDRIVELKEIRRAVVEPEW